MEIAGYMDRVFSLEDDVSKVEAVVFPEAFAKFQQAQGELSSALSRLLVVTENGEISGVLSVRDIVRCWTDDGAICDVPASAGLAPG